ncbi:MAG: class I SAM-dependent RNA methyltransferase [Candidatus Cloacimonetes bacterium]|nr:class I SAM-dependent RNA methyltransferase [Candidatus Cloacimonadota bacterium]MDD4155417.1 class I SAM-dependent RNA methyltransferase [Candidatus Cloacimonadota bacterium]
MYEYIKTNKYFAQVTGSLEKYAIEEIKNIGAEVLNEVPRGIRFQCNQETLYRLLYTSRIIQRILAPLLSLQCHSEKYLYNQAYSNIEWTNLFSLNDTFSIITNVSNSHIKHSLYAGQILKDAICDQFRDKYGSRPNFTTKNGDIVFNLHINKNWATISLDISGTSMHKRGYRTQANTAPMQETLAATIIQLSNWTGQKRLIDPMCGSGTLLCEGLMKYCNIPAGYLRSNSALAFLPDFNLKIWETVKQTENNKIIELPDNLIYGSDINEDCIEITKNNLSNLPYGNQVQLKISRFQDLKEQNNSIIVTNPPYGLRIGKTENINKTYNDLGDFLKQKCKQSEAYILCGKAELVPELRLRASWKKTLKNADIETKLAKIIIR